MNFKLILFVIMICQTLAQQDSENDSTSLVPDQDDDLLILSTLSGSFVGVGQRTGEIRWRQDNEPAVKVPYDMSQTMVPMFLPDPKDGSLYLYGPGVEVLKKLPYTIPELVAESPCRSTDGILYIGRKIDTWFSIDLVSGEKEQLLGFEETQRTCPLEAQKTIFVGRTEYTILMTDSKRKERKWNITFYDYTAGKMEGDNKEDYEFVHLTTSSTGRVVTLDRRSGIILWELDLESPVIAVYTVNGDSLINVPFTSVAEGTLDNLIKKLTLKPEDIELFPTLYVGEYRHGLYALPSLIDIVDSSQTPQITNAHNHFLIEGPLRNNDEQLLNVVNDSDNDQIIDDTQEANSIIRLGHYNISAEYKSPNQPLQITGSSDPIIQTNSSSNKITFIVPSYDELKNSTPEIKSWKKAIAKFYHAANAWLNQQENKGLKMIVIILAGCVVTMFWYLNAQFKEFQHLSQTSRENSRTSSHERNGSITVSEEISEGTVKVGKIVFKIDQVLGKGCEGTFVYKGEFDGRSVAVKRLLPDCFTFADREVALLRESDAHANVVRYYCTEQDRMFRYIALELAEATLQDYVLGKYDRQSISVKNILLQATSGLAHLHSLDIVHRDIKPHNVLLSMPGPRGEIRAMISDFGLCKKLQLGRMSFSRRSGVTGTDGWIAPEMLNGERTTCAVDIFSLGCVFYYVLSNGKHPFGDTLRRQANILCDESDLSSLQNTSENDKELALILIKAMIDSDPVKRPPALAIQDYPFFWMSPRILNFFQEVSDRVEKDEQTSIALMSLETGGPRVVEDDWRLKIDVEVANDLRKYRSYRGESVRDLLRALRNKKHHYRELTPEAQASLGEVPVKFTEYWLSRFPHLLAHSWCVMQRFRLEATLRDYYHTDYEFTTYHAYSEVINIFNNMTYDKFQSNSINTINPSWRLHTSVDWSPNRARFRHHQKKKPRKTDGNPISWTLPSDNRHPDY